MTSAQTLSLALLPVLSNKQSKTPPLSSNGIDLASSDHPCVLEKYIGNHTLTPQSPSFHTLRPDLIIANGGGGQVGVIQHLAQTFLSVTKRRKKDNLCIAWHQSNTSGSHEAIRYGAADIAIVYDIKRIKDAIHRSEAARVEHVWMDRFLLIGPRDNPNPNASGSIEEAIEWIMQNGIFLTRVDASTAHFREAEVVERIVRSKRRAFGLPDVDRVLEVLVYQGWKAMKPSRREECGITFSSVDQARLEEIERNDETFPEYDAYLQSVPKGFYRPFKLLPQQAAKKADELGWYTLSDCGIFYSLPSKFRTRTAALMDGKTQDSSTRQESFFLNPAFALLSAKSRQNDLAREFVEFMACEETQRTVIPTFIGRSELSESRNALFESAFESHKQLFK